MQPRLNRRARGALFCCAAVALIALSCHDDILPPKGVGLRIDVDSTQATVTWNRSHRVDKLIMGGNGTWFIVDEGGLVPPITYKEAPAGSQELQPSPSAFDPAVTYYTAALIRSDRNGDRLVASGAVGGETMELPTLKGQTFIYAPRIGRITPPGITPEIWEFLDIAAVPNASWKRITDESEVEALLNVQPVILRVLARDENGVQRLYEYRDLRAAQVDVDGETMYFVWDEVPVTP